jgi:hypothetical protein
MNLSPVTVWPPDGMLWVKVTISIMVLPTTAMLPINSFELSALILADNDFTVIKSTDPKVFTNATF